MQAAQIGVERSLQPRLAEDRMGVAGDRSQVGIEIDTLVGPGFPAGEGDRDAVSIEQRAALAERAAKRGKTLDDAKLLRVFQRLLLATPRR